MREEDLVEVQEIPKKEEELAEMEEKRRWPEEKGRGKGGERVKEGSEGVTSGTGEGSVEGGKKR